MAKTLYEKLFDAHVMYQAENETPLLYIDRHLVHEVTSPQAFDGLARPRSPGTSAGGKPSPPWITTFQLRPKTLMPAVKWRASRCRS
ncbi:hypothetical protein ACLB1R_32165 [Escherichia coli]